MIKIKINSEALTLNMLYPSSKTGRRFLSKKGKDFKTLVSIETKKALLGSSFSFDPETHYLSTEIFFYTPRLVTAKGRISKGKPDTSNCIKALEDAVFETLGIDDCYNLDVSASVNYSDAPVIVCIIRKHLNSSKFDTTLS